MSTQRTEEQKLNPKPCKVGHCDNMCYCTEDKTTTDESVVGELAIFWNEIALNLPKSIERSALGDEKIFRAFQIAYPKMREYILATHHQELQETRTAEQERVVGILQNMKGVYSARDVIEKATEAIRGNENGV